MCMPAKMIRIQRIDFEEKSVNCFLESNFSLQLMSDRYNNRNLCRSVPKLYKTTLLLNCISCVYIYVRTDKSPHKTSHIFVYDKQYIFAYSLFYFIFISTLHVIAKISRLFIIFIYTFLSNY